MIDLIGLKISANNDILTLTNEKEEVVTIDLHMLEKRERIFLILMILTAKDLSNIHLEKVFAHVVVDFLDKIGKKMSEDSYDRENN